MRALLISVLFLLTLWASQGRSQVPSCPPLTAPKHQCSYTALNGDCDLVIDRFSPAAPPTIYVRRGSTVTVKVEHSSPFENISLDWKSTAIVLPPDSFQIAFSALSSTLGKFSASVVQGLEASAIDDIVAKQEALYAQISPAGIIAEFARVSQPPPSDLCKSSKAIGLLSPPNPWLQPEEWKKETLVKLDLGIGSVEKDPATFQQGLDEIAGEIAGLPHTSDLEKAEQKELQARQAALDGALTDKIAARKAGTAEPAATEKKKLQSLRAALVALHFKAPPSDFHISDAPQLDKNNRLSTWALNYANVVSAATKNVAGDGDPKPLSLFAAVAAPTVQQLLQISVQFQSQARIEASTGLMVPVRPYHSYTASAVASNGVQTGNVVQETLTYTVVPVISINTTLGHELSAGGQRLAFFGTVDVGVNAASTTVEFGIGPSISWRSLVLSALLDVGRDTRLAGGFTVGEALAATNPAKPLTTTVWAIKPAFAAGVRIPLGGSGK